jgi:type I restriction enzyme R subunit
MPKNFISEDDIEKSILDLLEKENFGYQILKLDPSPEKMEVLPDGTGRTDKKECVLPDILWSSLKRLNPSASESMLKTVFDKLTDDNSNKDIVQVNYELYSIIRNGYKIDFTNKKGAEDFLIVKVVDFDNPENNVFTAASQMWIKGRYYWRRPDVLVFVNGMPCVFFELKNSIVKVEEAYTDNLTNYKKDIPNLFALNQICVLSNGLETRVGAYTSTYDYFFEWLKVDSETETPDRKAIYDSGTSIYYFVRGLLRKDKLLDYIENFIMFDSGKKLNKIVAENHQYFGVNNLMESVNNRKNLNGKLGVFWHTQGSGKSYSMVFFARKVNRKLRGNFTFLIITDRDELNTQIHKTFIRTGVISEKDQCMPSDSKTLRDYLGSNKPFIFTLIHKFRYDKGKSYPVLTKRDDVIVLVDEAHRTEYKDLAQNMRTGLPNANFVAFTGTPLLRSGNLTRQWFGNYVSIYNFAQSVDDGATVPLYYSRRVPEVGLTNNFLDDDVVDIIERENLNDAETRALENSNSRILEVIKRDDRLEKIAKDIAYHFPRRGYLGKGMVVSVDKFTAVKMYQKVQRYWEEEKKSIIEERNHERDDVKRNKLTAMLDYMNTTKMAVVISEDADEVEKFKSEDIDITPIREEINRTDANGYDIEDRFQDPENPFRLVFVCAMWLTGFDVKNLSTIYLDKPMKSHTLMQAIARANRVYPGKESGLIVDYVNVFSYMRQALGDYATGDSGSDMPVKNIDELVKYLDAIIKEADSLLSSCGIILDDIISLESVYEKVNAVHKAYDELVGKKEISEKFKVLTNLMVRVYEAAKPEIFEMGWSNEKFSPLNYLNGLFMNSIDDEKLNKARNSLTKLLDSSVTSKPTSENPGGLVINGNEVIDLSKLDFDQLHDEFKHAEFKNLQIQDLESFIEKALKRMIDQNRTRIRFAERYKRIIDQYNAGATDNEICYEELVKLLKEMTDEESRKSKENLSEEELEIFDLLCQDKSLSKADVQKVKLAAKNLYHKLVDKKEDLLVVDWYKDEQPKLRVRSAIADSLNADLPESYDKESFNSKTNLLLSTLIDKSVQGYEFGCGAQR